MNQADKAPFMELLKTTYGAYAEPLPEKSILIAWWTILEPFPIGIVRAALQAYIDENDKFAPKPAAISKRCKLMDGRPGPEEAWALALTSRSEEDTVIWTQECAEAYALASPIMALGDEVGARMAFKEAYTRLVVEARSIGKPASWLVSAGWDQNRRKDAIRRAESAGLLPAPTVAALLPYEDSEQPTDPKARAQLAEIRRMLEESAAKKEKEREEAFERIQAEEMEWKKKTQQTVDEYLKINPHMRPK